MSSNSYSDLAHIPWALVVLAAAIGLHLAGVPISFIGAAGGTAAMFVRGVTKGEYQAIEERFGGQRANMPDFYGFLFWRWNGHTQRETLYAALAAVAAAVAAHLAFGL